MNARFDVRRAQTELSEMEGRHRLARARLQHAANDLVNAELALQFAKERARSADRRTSGPRTPFAWIDSWPFILSGLIVACMLLWAASQGWLA